MIISNIKGGLGNQLFQYAAGRALSIQNKTELFLDVSELQSDSLRNFDLEKFNVNFDFADKEQIIKLKATSSLKRFQQRLKTYPKKSFYKQIDFGFDTNFHQLRSPVYIQGYFQSEKFFKPYSNIIRKELELKKQYANLDAIVRDMQCQQSISIHIRQGDYATSSQLQVHGLLSKCYYKSAINRMRVKYKNPVFYIFTDSPQLIEEAFIGIDQILVSGKWTKNHFEDFYLMTQCRHNIIANSSFSWWAAWLNENKQKTVIAPKNWFRNGPKNTSDLIVDNWEII